MATATQHLRTDALYQWLDRVNAAALWQKQLDGSTLTAFNINGRVAIVQLFNGGDGEGWEIYIPSSNSGKIADALDAAAEALGVDGCRGLVESIPHSVKVQQEPHGV